MGIRPWISILFLSLFAISFEGVSSSSLTVGGTVPEIVQVIFDQNTLMLHSNASLYTVEWIRHAGPVERAQLNDDETRILPLDTALLHDGMQVSLRITAP